MFAKIGVETMRFLIWLGGILSITILPPGQVSAIDGDPSPWRIAPPIVKELSMADRDARDELLRLIEKKQDPAYRDKWILEIPNHASGVPASYDLLMYRKYVTWAGTATRIEIQVRDGIATIDLCDSDGLWKAKVPSIEIDRLVRQLAYGFHATERVRSDELVLEGGSTFATHTPYQTVEVISRDMKHPCQLKTPQWQAIADDINDRTNGIRGFVHTRIATEVLKLTREHGKLLPEADEAREILARIRRVPRENGGEELYLRDELPAVESVLYAHLAIQRKLADALPDLRRLGLKDEAKHLEITTAANPQPLITEAILAFRADSHLAYWAIDFAKDERHPERIQWLIDVLPKDIGPYHAEEILDYLMNCRLSNDQVRQIDSVFAESSTQQVRISAANALLCQTDEPKYYEYLWDMFRNSPRMDNDDHRSPWQMSAHHLLRYSARSGKKRETTRTLLLAFIAEIPAEKPKAAYPYYGLIRYIGLLGTREDLPLLTNIVEKESAGMAGDAIEAMAHIDPALAMKHVHHRLDHQLATSTDWSDYGKNVSKFFDLIIWQRDTAAIPKLQRAWSALNKDRLPWWGEQYDPQSVIDILEAKSVDRRLALTLAFIERRYVDPTLLRDVAQKLIDEGADPEKCKPLFQSVEERRRRGR